MARRMLVAWVPDWPVISGIAEAQVPPHEPAAVIAANKVSACNEAARADGVRRGMRRRDAQARCPGLHLLSGNTEREARDFEPVLACVEELSPGVAPLRPGLIALHSPARFYGGEAEAAAVIAEKLVTAGIWDCRFGIADNLFAAEQAARRAGQQDCLIVPEGGAPAFLHDFDVRTLDNPELTDLLWRLGIRTLGALAALPASDVLARFGADGARLHRLAAGRDDARLSIRQPPPDLICQADFEPPLESTEAVAFSVRRLTEKFVDAIGARNLVCTRVVIEAESNGEVVSSRLWAHARWFRADDLVDRVHWQLGARAGESSLPGPVSAVRLIPEALEPDVIHADGLWGNADTSQVERGVAKVQALLGYEAVLTPVLQGGRSPAARQAGVPWGERADHLRPRDLPWPGSIPPPAPARVFAEPWPALVVGTDGHPTQVTERGVVTSEPARFHPRVEINHTPRLAEVAAWAGPWPVEETWWEAGSTRLSRFQVVGMDGRAWLMTCVGDQWFTEASYD